MSFVVTIRHQKSKIVQLEREREVFRDELRVLLNRERKFKMALKKIATLKCTNPSDQCCCEEVSYMALKAIGMDE